MHYVSAIRVLSKLATVISTQQPNNMMGARGIENINIKEKIKPNQWNNVSDRYTFFPFYSFLFILSIYCMYEPVDYDEVMISLFLLYKIHCVHYLLKYCLFVFIRLFVGKYSRRGSLCLIFELFGILMVQL